jgi:hypothetical protein
VRRSSAAEALEDNLAFSTFETCALKEVVIQQATFQQQVKRYHDLN